MTGYWESVYRAFIHDNNQSSIFKIVYLWCYIFGKDIRMYEFVNA